MKQIMFPFFFVLPFLLMACSKKKEVDQGELAGRAAKLYYEQLLKGQYEAFLGGENRSEKLPDSYRKQLLTNLRQFVEQQKAEHNGIHSVSFVSSIFSEKDSTASAFLLFHYGDRTAKQVVVPMLKKKGVWIMR